MPARETTIDSFDSDSIRTENALVGLCKLVQRRAENLAGLSNQCCARHVPARLREGATEADADRGRAAEQRIVVAPRRGVTLDQHLALEGVVLHRVAAGVIEVGIAAKNLAVAKQNHAAALADPTIE